MLRNPHAAATTIAFENVRAVLIRKAGLESTPVAWTGAHGQVGASEDGRSDWYPSARRFEFGTRAQAVFGGFAESLRWLNGLG